LIGLNWPSEMAAESCRLSQAAHRPTSDYPPRVSLHRARVILAAMSFSRMIKRSDYYLVTFTMNERPPTWAWEIKAPRQAMDFRYTGSGFESQAAAEMAGNRKLKEFQEALAIEEKR